MAITKYDYSVLHENLISGLNAFLTPLWNWKKIEKTENLDYTGVEGQYPSIKFYIDDNTALSFTLNRGNNTTLWASPYFTVETNAQSNTFNSVFSTGSTSDYTVFKGKTARIRFTKVASDGFLLGIDCYSGNNRVGDYTCPLIMCCKVGSKYALIHNGLLYTQPPTISATANKIFYDGMIENETVSLTRRVTENIEQLIPICTNTGLYSANGFTPAITYSDTLVPQKFTLGGKQYYGNGLMVLLDE